MISLKMSVNAGPMVLTADSDTSGLVVFDIRSQRSCPGSLGIRKRNKVPEAETNHGEWLRYLSIRCCHSGV